MGFAAVRLTRSQRGQSAGPAPAPTASIVGEEEHELTLHAEEPVVETRAVPKERVRMEKDTVTDQETVSGEVRKERIEADGADDETR